MNQVDKVDKVDRKTKRWDWLPDHMPRVARLMAEQREQWGAEHVALCWRRGVLEHQSGWYFAREGPIAVGVPWDHPDLVNFAALSAAVNGALLMMRPPEGANDGA